MVHSVTVLERLERYLDYLQLQHPHLAEFCDIDMKMVEVTLGLTPV